MLAEVDMCIHFHSQPELFQNFIQTVVCNGSPSSETKQPGYDESLTSKTPARFLGPRGPLTVLLGLP